MENFKWTFSKDDEYWPNDSFETKEQAIEAGRNDAECFEYGEFYIGRVVPIDKTYLLENFRLFDLENFNEDMAETAGGEEDYAPEEKHNLDKAEELSELIADFIVKNFETTMSFTLEDIETVRI